MFGSDRFVEFINKALKVYSEIILEISKQFETIYLSYPYLFVILLLFIPVFIFCTLRFLKWSSEFFIGQKKVSSPAVRELIKISSFYLTLEIYNSAYNSLVSQFGLFEKVFFVIGSSLVSSLLWMSLLILFTRNAYDQFKILLEDLDTYKLKSIKISFLAYFFIFEVLQQVFDSGAISIIKYGVFYVHSYFFLVKNQDELSKPLINILNEQTKKYLKLLLNFLAPISFIILISVGFLYKVIFLLSYFDMFKKISAKITRLQVEQISLPSKECKLPEEYSKFFKSLDLKLYRPKWFGANIESIDRIINQWLDDPIKDSFVHLVGDPGSGRRVIVEEISDRFKDLNPIRIEIPRKIITEDDFDNFISQTLSSLNETSEDKHRLIIFSGVENLFINKPLGFDALKKMFDHVNNSENDFFWLNVCDQYPWMHIESFFGQVQHRNVIKLKSFANSEIQKLIEIKNSNLGFKVLFDKALYETNRGASDNGHEHASSQYFTMIWEQSSGNPLMAQELWLNSIQVHDDRSKKIKIGLPKRNDASIFKDIIIDSFFVYNALVRHSRLSFEECCLSTSLSERVVRFALVFGENQHFIKRDKNQNYYIAQNWYATIIQTLKTKNLIYG